MFRVFEGQTADTVWCEIAQAFRKAAGAMQPSRVGEMREILHSAISISNPTQRWVTSRSPTINVAFALAEVVWILNGRNDSEFLNYFNRQLPKFAGDGMTYHGAYGRRLRSHFGIDQLQRAYEALKATPSSRQIVLQIWDSKIDLPSVTGQEASPDIPCNIVSLLKVRSGKLEWLQIMRSNDIYRGLPYNFVQFTTMHEILAGWLGLGLGEYNHISDSLHVYQKDFAHIEASSLEAAVPNTDSLALSKEESEKCFLQLAKEVENIIDESNPPERLLSAVRKSELPTPFRNMFCVISAEGARRRRSREISDEIMLNCTNLVYNHLYARWLERF